MVSTPRGPSSSLRPRESLDTTLDAVVSSMNIREEFVEASEFENSGQRVVVGQRLMQAVSDICLGWIRMDGLDGQTRDFYLRQLRDWKRSGLEAVGAGSGRGLCVVRGPVFRRSAHGPAALGALGGVVLYAASKLMSIPEFRRLWLFRRREFVLAVITLVGAVVVGILQGVVLAIALSLLVMLFRLARPHEGVLGRVPGIAGMHDVDDYPDARTIPGCMFYRYAAPLGEPGFLGVGAQHVRRMRVPVCAESSAQRPTGRQCSTLAA